MKAGAACVLAATEALVSDGAALGGTLLVVGTTDEEYWSRGAHALAASGLIDRCDYCIVPEPAPPATIVSSPWPCPLPPAPCPALEPSRVGR